MLGLSYFAWGGGRTVERGGGGVGGVGGPGPAKVLFNRRIDCLFGPGAMKYPWARTGSRRPWVEGNKCSVNDFRNPSTQMDTGLSKFSEVLWVCCTPERGGGRRQHHDS